jgi:hypothetical protein
LLKPVSMHLAKVATILLVAGLVTGSITYHQVLDGVKPAVRAAAAAVEWLLDHEDQIRDAKNQTQAWASEETPASSPTPG